MSTQTHTRRPASAPHVFHVGDVVAVMDWQRKTYMPAVVTYYRHGDEMNLRDLFDGHDFHAPATEVLGSMVQALHHFDVGPDRPHVGMVFRADGSAHHITTDGRCLQCYVA